MCNVFKKSGLYLSFHIRAAKDFFSLFPYRIKGFVNRTLRIGSDVQEMQIKYDYMALVTQILAKLYFFSHLYNISSLVGIL